MYPTVYLQYGFTIRLSTIGEIVKYVEGRVGSTKVEEKAADLLHIPLSAGISFVISVRYFPQKTQFLKYTY